MKHKTYPSIENSYQAKHMDFIRTNGFAMANVVWCVTEKLHGSNLGVYCDATGCQTASKNNMLQESESDSFYKFGTIKETVYKNCADLFDYVVNYFGSGDIKNIIVYGELFGGAYSHPDVPKNNQVSSVQKGVFYSPDIHFHIVDVVVVYENDQEMFLNYFLVERICKDLEIPWAEILFSGTMDKCLEYPNDGQSTIPGILGLPVLEDNIVEGTVVKPVIAEFFACGSRVILKNKNEKFKEKYPNKPIICVLIQAEREGGARILEIGTRLQIPVFINEIERAVKSLKFLLDFYKIKNGKK